jgi:lipopolysaccharide export system ATP-binding protein
VSNATGTEVERGRTGALSQPTVSAEGIVLRAEGIYKTYGKRTVLHGVTIEVRGGGVVGLLGPNGAGKTTTFSIIVGLVRPQAGRVILNNEDLTGMPMYQRARKGISYLPQEPSVFRKLTVEENLLAILETLPLTAAQRRARLAELLAELNIAHLAGHKAYSLSGGERRRVEITRALVISPAFMLLDEPLSGIDPLSVVDVQGVILQLRGKGIGVLLTDHNVRETLGICDRAYILNKGSVLEEGTPHDITISARARQVYLGEQFRL